MEVSVWMGMEKEEGEFTSDGGGPGSDPLLVKHVAHQVEEEKATDIWWLRVCQYHQYLDGVCPELTMFISWDSEVVVKPS